jgi:plastocyanin
MSQPPAFCRSAAAAAVTLLAAVAFSQPAAADSAPASATVTVNERGFIPPNVFIQRGGTVTWTDTGSDSHDIETGSAPTQVLLSLSPGQSASNRFVQPGVYHYTAGTDCLNNVGKALFLCLDYTVVVLDDGTPLPTPNPSPSATPIPATIPVQQNATIQIADTGFSPVVTAITTGGTATWLNAGMSVHSATSTRAPNPSGFDTGGLAQGQSNVFAFNDAGTYAFTSSTDCLSGQQAPVFSCQPAYLLVVPNAVGSSVAVPSDILARGLVPPPVPAAPNTVVTVDDSQGFQPRQLTIKLGQTVTWINRGQNVHSIVSNVGVLPAFDSGGLGGTQIFTWTPTQPGVYGYHSSTDSLGLLDPSCKCSLYGGTVMVGQ